MSGSIKYSMCRCVDWDAEIAAPLQAYQWQHCPAPPAALAAFRYAAQCCAMPRIDTHCPPTTRPGYRCYCCRVMYGNAGTPQRCPYDHCCTMPLHRLQCRAMPRHARNAPPCIPMKPAPHSPAAPAALTVPHHEPLPRAPHMESLIAIHTADPERKGEVTLV